MLTEHLDKLRLHLKSESDLKRSFSLIWPRITQSRRDTITRDAERYYHTPIPTWTATDMLKNAPDYLQAHKLRRQMLASFVMCACAHDTERYDERIFDLAWAICEESTWSFAQEGDLPLREDPYTSEFAETASLLAWTACLAYKPILRISTRLDARIRREITRRLSDPVSKNMEFPTSDPRVLAPLIVAVLLSEQDSSRRWGALRRLFYWLEEGLPRLSAPSIELWEKNACLVMDALTIAAFATGNEVDLRRMLKPFSAIPLYAWLYGSWWVNPGERSMQCSPSGAALYRFGRSAGNDPLRALGAQLYKMENRGAFPDSGMTDRVLTAMYETDIERENLRPGPMPSGMSVGSTFATARVERFTASMHAGDPDSVHCDAGDILLFYRGRPVLFDAGAGHLWTRSHNLPSIASQGQLPGGKIAYPESQVHHDAHYLSADLAEAYPPQLHLESWQRTVILPFDRCEARLIEMFAFSRDPQEVSFHFITPSKPMLIPGQNAAYLGDVSLQWESALTAQVDTVGTTWRITLTFPEPVRSGNATFIIRPVEI